MNELEMFGLNIEPKELHELVFIGVECLKKVRNLNCMTNEQENHTERLIVLGEAILQRIPIEGNGMTDSYKPSGNNIE